MLHTGFILLAVATALGTVLAVLYLWGEGRVRPPWPFGALHGLLALGGFALLLLALRGAPRGLVAGTAGFGVLAAWFLAAAALIGGGILAARLLRKRFGSALVGIHAAVAVTGFVILAAYVFLR